MASDGRKGNGASVVRIELAPSRARDMDLAWRASGLDRKTLARNWTWHHHQDVGVMQLVDRAVHRAFPHRGGLSILRAAMKKADGG